jgi:hypothetical protein
MMKNELYILGAGILIILILATAGCVTPPKGTSSTTSGSSNYNPGTSVTTPTTFPVSYLTEVTPYLTNGPAESPTPATGYSTFTTPTPVPTDLSCLVYLKTQYYAYNVTAIEFDLKNPPMYISYTVIPTNVTINKYVEAPGGGGQYQTVQFSTYSPDSWFEVTVMNKTTGNIYLQDGFGTGKGYSTYLNRTLEVMNTDDVLIQFRGNLITATAGIWVKPIENFDNPENMTFAECKYWGQIRNSIAVATTTTLPTWAPVNVVQE